ncbi:KAP family P-loop NTPase fold protein [Winogradskyella forsetii]|uniref:KAP family P-loop NTPase fold protein n=1 Tax=Winogradskyella forsetii TaxID=2686077 RepID=UPI0015BC877B|nr:P-loop NTPase fold protein [Winogradskyella forsetii]
MKQKKTKSNYREYKNEMLVFTFLIGLYVILHTPINLLINKILINPVLKYVSSRAWYNDIIFWSVISYLIFKTIKFWKRQYYPNVTYAILLSLSAIYFINRMKNWWEYSQSSLSDKIYYADLLLVASIIVIILMTKTYFAKRTKSNKKKQLGFIVDKPLTNISDDQLKYSDYAQIMTEKILNTTADKSFAIGINAKWGTGKTSFLNFIKEQIISKDSNIIQIDFSPWNIESPKAIISDFFETFEKELNKYNSNISRHLNNYSRKLLALNEIDSTKSTYKLLSTVLSKDKTLSALKQEIEKNINRIDKKIIVFIDDLDRLDNDEIIEILRIIRNTADFKNTFFLVAYDRNYIINALTRYNSYNKEGFLEKIFQLEINLPNFNPIELRQKLFENLSIYFPDKKDTFTNVILPKVQTKISESLEENIQSMRDVVLLSNGLIMNYENLKGNIDFKDLILIEILRIKYSSIYEILKSKNNNFIVKNSNRFECYSLRKDENEENIYKTVMEKYHNLNINYLNIGKIKNILSIVFNPEQVNHLSLINVSKYENYFSYRLREITLNDPEFLVKRNDSLNKLLEYITQSISKGYEHDLLKRFYSINNYKSFDDYKKIIKSIFYLAEHKSNKSNNVIGFEYEALLRKCSYSRNWTNIGIRSSNHNDFIKDVFTSSTSKFKLNVLNSLINDGMGISQFIKESFPIESEEAQNILNNAFLGYIETHRTIDEDFIGFLKNTLKTDNKGSGINQSYEIDEKIRVAALEYLETQTVDDIIKIAIKKSNINGFELSKDLLTILGNSQSLLTFLLNHQKVKDSKYINEFNKFVNKMQKFNRAQFHFEVIPIT